MTNDKLLRIYVNDHLAASRATLELAKRCRRSNAQLPLAAALDDLIAAIGTEHEVLAETVRRIGGSPSSLKQAAGWIAEKAGRLKLNGSLVSYSDLSRVLELEGLMLAAAAQRALWKALADLGDPRLDGIDAAGRMSDADRRLADLARHHAAAVRTAFT